MRRPKIFGIGLSRTGTTSLTQALRLLRYIAVHFPHDPLTQEELTRWWADRTRLFRFTAAEIYDAVTDTPAASTYRQLADLYPDSRFVLTVRDEGAWLASCAEAWETAVARQYAGPMGAYCRAVNRACYGTEAFDAERFVDAYRNHLRDVQAHFSGTDRLLVLDVAEGWEPLCAFLRQPVPARPFPHLNAGARE